MHTNRYPSQNPGYRHPGLVDKMSSPGNAHSPATCNKTLSIDALCLGGECPCQERATDLSVGFLLVGKFIIDIPGEQLIELH